MIEEAGKIMEWSLVISTTVLIFWLTYRIYYLLLPLFWRKKDKNQVVKIEKKNHQKVDRWAWQLIICGYGLALLVLAILLLIYYWAIVLIMMVVGYAGRKIFRVFFKPLVWIGKQPFQAATNILGNVFRDRRK
ncbi:MAG: hypothetical protein WB502_06720 [Thermoactinomyces sp.]